MNLYIGCPIWSFKGWVGNFYPAGTQPSEFLHEYARRLSAIEGNTTFYAVPAEKTLDNWASETPGSFRFCAKVPKAISHTGKLEQGIERAHEFTRIMSRLGSRLGPMFLQLPPSYPPRLLGDLETFLAAWPSDVRLGVEVRHPDWFDGPNHEALTRLLSEYRMARVVIDTRPIRSLDGDDLLRGSVYQQLLKAREAKPDVPVIMERTTDFIFLRFIGHPDLAQNQPLMEEWGEYISGQIQQGADAYVFCHSPENLTAPLICREFHHLVAEKAAVSVLPWDNLGPGVPRQAPLL
jgi:uncharacterized protein YecE (DUF72 family)